MEWLEKGECTLKMKDVKTSKGIEYHDFLEFARHALSSSGLRSSLNFSNSRTPYFWTRYNVWTRLVFTCEFSVCLAIISKVQ